MENNLKYFKPEISDIHVGYECEVAYLEKDNWTPMKVRHQEETEDFIKAVFNYNRRIRTPYLTKEQIEAEGWIEKSRFQMLDVTDNQSEGGNTTSYGFEKGNYFLIFNDFSRRICLIYKDPSKETISSWSVQRDPEHFNFNCICPSINEFRKIQKWLKIC